MSFNFFIADRIKELSRTENTNNIVLDGAATGFSSFDDFFASGDTVFYAITDNVKYEVGSGAYVPVGSDRTLTRNVLRSSNLNSGPYHLYGSGAGSHAGQEGYFHPLWLTRSAAISGVGVNGGPFTSAHEHVFSGIPGVTFYMPTEHMGHAQTPKPADLSGVDYAVSGGPVDFDAGLKEVFVTYPGKTAVLNGYGLDSDIKEPKQSGIAFWKNEQVINYTSQMSWDDDNNFLGIGQQSPSYALDIGGDPSYSIINVSGIIEGGSGIMFSGGATLDTAITASGGLQFEPFHRNRTGTSSNGIIQLSGIVDEIIDIQNQVPKAVLAGPAHDCGCVDAPPTFRLLQPEDLPLAGSDGLDNRYVIQNNDGAVANDPYPYIAGQVALYNASGSINYSSGIIYDAANDRLGLGGGSVGIIDPAYTLDVSGNMAALSGNFDQIIFADNLIRIGESAGTRLGNLDENYYVINLGYKAGAGSTSGVQNATFIGRSAGFNTDNASGVSAIGYNALADARQVNHSVLIGDHSASGASGIYGSVALGSGSFLNAKTARNLVGIGNLTASGADQVYDSVAVGDSLSFTRDAQYLVAIGCKVLNNASGLNQATFIGTSAGQDALTLQSAIGVGNSAFKEASGITQSVAIGEYAGHYASGFANTVLLSQNAGVSGLSFHNVNAIGLNAAKFASGTQNIYIGMNAGASLSGHNNIEIIASGAAASFLTHEASGKINIGKTIVGDIYSGRVTLGVPDDVSPSATVYIRPKDANEPALVVQHQGSGSKTPYFALQSGDATTFYHVTNSGDVIHSGYIEPSGGLSLPSITPANWMNSTTNKLYNDAGTLKWNGSALAVGGGFTSFNLTNGAVVADAITDGQTVTISGVSGVEAQYDAASNFLSVSASGLSGVLQDQITAQTYKFFSASSGVEGHGRNQLNQMGADSVLAISGVSGIKIDYADMDDGTNSSGLFVIGYDPTTTYSWKLATSGATDTVANDDYLTISGVSGINLNFQGGATNYLEIGANGLSGYVEATDTFLLGQILENTTSGTAISGVATWASGEFARLGVGSEGTSGIKRENAKYIMDPFGSGYLGYLGLNHPHTQSVHIGSGQNVTWDYSSSTYQNHSGVYIGNNAYQGELERSVVIGQHEHGKGVKTGGSVVLGYKAGAGLGPNDVMPTTYGAGSDSSWNVILGYEAASGARYLADSTVIGAFAGQNAGGNTVASDGGSPARRCVVIGWNAGSGLHSVIDGIYIGTEAGQRSRVSVSYSSSSQEVGIGSHTAEDTIRNLGAVFVGPFAGMHSSYNSQVVGIGRSAMSNASGLHNAVFMGYQAGWYASGIPEGESDSNLIGIGSYAGRNSSNSDNMTAVGFYAGSYASGCKHSTFIGGYAGYKRSSENSIIISNRSSEPTSYDAPWSTHDQDSVLDIGGGIQGRITTGEKNIHLGLELDPILYKTDINSITNNTVTITNSSASDRVLALRRHPDDHNEGDSLKESLQSAPMMVTEALNGDGVSPNFTFDNTIINKDGYFKLPIATNRSGTGTAAVLKDADNRRIAELDGTMCMLNGGGEKVLCVYLGVQGAGGAWHKIAYDMVQFT